MSLGGVLAGFEVTDITLDGELRPVLDSKSQTRWFNYQGDLITFDDDDTRGAKAAWGVSVVVLLDIELVIDISLLGCYLLWWCKPSFLVQCCLPSYQSSYDRDSL